MDMRQRRLICAGFAYHVTARANRQELILEDNGFKQLFLDVVAQCKKKYNFKLRNFCIMGNHVHMDILPGEAANISKIMQWILSVFAMRYNKIHNYKGHVWYDRFKSKIIETVEHFINTFCYIASNPVRANIVKHPLEFAYSGIVHHKKKDYKLLDPPDDWLIPIIENFLNKFDPKNMIGLEKDCSFLPKKSRKSE